jgi:hypothetical protein
MAPGPPRAAQIPQPASAPRISFLEILRQNPFELAGMAELPEDPEVLSHSASKLRGWICTPGCLNDEQLAEALFVMIKVAQDDYDEGTYWPHLASRLGVNLDQPRQSKLGAWFRRGLRRCGYHIARASEGLFNLTPILIHAGIPRSAAPGMVQFVAHVLRQQGDDFSAVAGTDATLIAEITEAYTGPLQRNVRRLFRSGLRGASELWQAIVSVVRSKSDPVQLDEAIRVLPAALNPEAVRDAVMATEILVGASQNRRLIPRLKYDHRTGAVFLWLPGQHSEDWSIDPAGMRIAWDRGDDGFVGEFLEPLPDQVTLEPRPGTEGRRRVFVTRPEHWKGMWFDARTGMLEQGTVVDGSGLDPGTWFVLTEGTPDEAGEARRIPLNWLFSDAGKAWTAWEVEVPARSRGQTEFAWTVGRNRYRVKLGRRSGALVKLDDAPVAFASTDTCDRVPVCSSAPRVWLDRDQVMRVQVCRLGGDTASRLWIDLSPDQATRIPAREPGIYEIREPGSLGRAMLEFALLPGLSIGDAASDPDGNRAAVTLSADPEAGLLEPIGGFTALRRIATRTWEVNGSTVDPWILVRWRWSDGGLPDLSFRIPVPGLRWRIKGPPQDSGRWSRELITVDRKIVLESDAQLEIQAPEGADVSINGQPARLQEGPWGQRGLRSLIAYSGAGFVTLGSSGRDHDAVLISSRPLVDYFDLEYDERDVIASWRGLEVPSGLVLLTWNPLRPAEPPVPIGLTDEQLRDPGEWVGSWDQLPEATYVALALAAPHGARGFGLAPQCYVAAAERRTPGRPLCRLIHRRSIANDAMGDWARLAFELEVDLLSERFGEHIDLAERLQQLQSENRLPLVEVLEWAKQLERAEILRSSPREWMHLTQQELLRCLEHPQMIPSWVAFVNGSRFEDEGAGIGSLIRSGLNPGWVHPGYLVSVPDGQLDSLHYAVRYFRDLWLISTAYHHAERFLLTERVFSSAALEPAVYLQLQAAAARKVVSFHESWGLPWPGLALPWRKGTARTRDEAGSHRHEISFKPANAGFDLRTVERFQQALGLRMLSVIGFSSVGGRRRLTWDSETGRGWTIERYRDQARGAPNESAPFECCRPVPGPLDVRPWDAAALADSLGLKASLTKWAGDEREPMHHDGPLSLRSLGVISESLKGDPISGHLHARVFDRPEILTRQLFGTVVSVPAGSEIPPVARLAWGIAWLDRIASRNPQDAFGPEQASGPGRLEFLQMLASALESWELLMIRCLALAAYVWWALYGGGLGISAKFETPVARGSDQLNGRTGSGCH